MVFGLEITCCPTRERSSPFSLRCARTVLSPCPGFGEKHQAALEAMLAGLPASSAPRCRRRWRRRCARSGSSRPASRCPTSWPPPVARADAERFAGLRTMLPRRGPGDLRRGSSHAGRGGGVSSTPSGCRWPRGGDERELRGRDGQPARPGHDRHGRARYPAPRWKLADDGELLLRGGSSCSATAACRPDARGDRRRRLASHRDVVATIDAVGYVTIVDRKKEVDHQLRRQRTCRRRTSRRR